jgi:hypothetical protein
LFSAAVVVALCCAFARVPSPIEVENARPGSPTWQLHAGGDVDVYASPISALPGEDVDVHVSTPYAYRVLVYRLGWYGGDGARLAACIPACDGAEPGVAQPQHPGFGGAMNWRTTDVIHTDATWASGYYLVEAVLARGGVATAFFVLREGEAERGSQILVQVPVNTWQAYNTWGGTSLYDSYAGPRGIAASFDRPLGRLAQSPMWWEIQFVRFLEREGYDVSYQTDVDTDRDPASLLRHRVVIVAGHDEYWSGAMRDGFEDALAAGTNLAFLGSNDGYWQVRYADGGQTIISAKSLYDPNPVVREKTAMFREIGRPECMLMGVQHAWFATLPHPLDYVATGTDTWFARTGFHAGDIVNGVVGREHDVLNPYPDSCIHPGLSVLFHYDGGGIDQDADAVRFTAPSGARVFASGAQQFAWGLDDWRSDGSLFPEPPVEPWRGVPVDPRLQQFMRNALDDLTRPAPPTGLTVQRIGDQLQVAVDQSVDPRVRGFVAVVRSGDGWLRICRGVVTCTGTAPTSRRLRVVAVSIDAWLRRSAGTSVVVERHA